MEIQSWKTAIKRNKLSKPVQIYEDLLVGKILNYGAGHGEDTEFLRLKGYDIYSYDKYFPSDADLNTTYDTIICNYVLNVIPTLQERIEVLKHIRSLLKPDGYAYITVRHLTESKTIKSSVKYNDGIVTVRRTFQRFYTCQEFVDFTGRHLNNPQVLSKNPIIIKLNK